MGSTKHTRREFIARTGAIAAGVALPVLPWGSRVFGGAPSPETRVVIARDDLLTRGDVGVHRDLLRKLLDASMLKLTGVTNAAAAWRGVFNAGDRVGIKVNTLGLSTQSVVAEAIAACLIEAGLSAHNILIWDRFDEELALAGYKLNKSTGGVRCRGTDATEIGSGYQRDVESSGGIGSCFSRIVAEELDAIVCVPVLKDHNLAGVSLGMKNFYGAIHNPNKYHDHNCDPYVADVVSHRFIRPKWRLTVCDATRAQYHGGPSRHPGFAWSFGGLIVSTDFVAADAVGADLLDTQRVAKGLKRLADDGRPTKHIATAAARGLGVADLGKIERIEV